MNPIFASLKLFFGFAGLPFFSLLGGFSYICLNSGFPWFLQFSCVSCMSAVLLIFCREHFLLSGFKQPASQLSPITGSRVTQTTAQNFS